MIHEEKEIKEYIKNEIYNILMNKIDSNTIIRFLAVKDKTKREVKTLGEIPLVEYNEDEFFSHARDLPASETAARFINDNYEEFSVEELISMLESLCIYITPSTDSSNKLKRFMVKIIY
jgi:hypothetical protein